MKKAVVGAHGGLKEWLLERMTNLVMFLVLFFSSIRLLSYLPLDYLNWQAFFSPLWYRISLLIFFAALMQHIWIEVHSALIDYIKPLYWRLMICFLVLCILSYSFLWSVFIIWRI